MRKMKRTFLPLAFLLIFLIIVGLQSCTYDCPAFPESETIWIPHQKGDVLKYFSDSDTMDFEVIESFKSGPDDFKGFMIMDYECDYEGYYLTNENNDGIKIKERITAFSGMEVEFSDVDNYKFSLYLDDFETDDFKVKYFVDTVINAIEFQDVFKVYKKNSNSDCRIDWIIKANNEGVIQYHDKTTDKIWTKIID
ncbi:hypothetical protein ACT3CD_16980 [Geofilum sp. OHC36d9]|uniref:hypothetical protein n=1 Tax=Geofilum sp. OHC36d9 TaxID=3458413 RepID=UPI004033B0C9